MTEIIIIHPNSQKQGKIQRSEKKIYNLSDFEVKISNASDFDLKFLQTCQILD